MPEKADYKSIFSVTVLAFKQHNSGILKTELDWERKLKTIQKEKTNNSFI